MNKARKVACIFCGRIILPQELLCGACLREKEEWRAAGERKRVEREARSREEEEINATIREFASRQSGLS